MKLHCLMGCFLLAPMAALADIEPGNWQLVVAVSVAGMGEMEPVTRTQCVTAEDARDPSRLFGQSNLNCTFADRQDTGSAFTFTVSCGGAVPVTGSGRVRYGRDTLDGDMELSGDAAGQKFVTRSKVNGRRTGACQ
jgi:hypothetical protein